MLMRVADTLLLGADILLLVMIINVTMKERVGRGSATSRISPAIRGARRDRAPRKFSCCRSALSIFGWVGMARLVRSQVLIIARGELRPCGSAIGSSDAAHPIPAPPSPTDEPDGRDGHALAWRGGAGGGWLTFLGIGVEDHASFGIMIFQYAGPTNVRAHPLLIFAPRARGGAADALLQPARRRAHRHPLAAAEVRVGEPEIRAPTVEARSRRTGASSPVVRRLSVSCASTSRQTLRASSGATRRSGRSGVVTWWIDGERAEITSVHAEPPGGGTGTRVMDAAEEELRRRGVKTAVLATTNDNSRALNFYIKRGYRLVRAAPRRDGPRAGAEAGCSARPGRMACRCRTCGSWRRRCEANCPLNSDEQRSGRYRHFQ